MDKSESIKNLAAALIAAQQEVKIVEKSADNPFFKSKYADLPAIDKEYKRVFLKHGLVVSQFPNGKGLTTLLMHISGEFVGATGEAPLAKNDPQGYGSMITYLRRYGLGSVLGIVSSEDDDDGNHASAHKTEVKQEAPRQAAQPAPRQDTEPKTLIEKLSEVRPTKSDKFFTLIFANGLKLGCGMHIAVEANKALEADHKVSVEYAPNDKGYMTALSLVEVIPQKEADVPF